MSINPEELDDAELKQALDNALGEMSAQDFEGLSARAPAEIKPDDKGRIPGRIVAVRGADVFVDIGGKSEAFVPVDEFEASDPPEPGQLRSFIVQGFDNDSGLMRLSLREARVAADLETLEVGDVIEGRVTGLNTGGLELDVKGLRAFMPKSQVDVVRIEDFAPFVGRRLECAVTEIDRRGRSLVVSRRKITERAMEEARQEVRYSLAEGQVRKGIVRRLADFGAFVDLGGGVDGLLHISDISFGRIGHPSELLKVGDEVEIQVLKIDLVKDRISLGLKQLKTDPWDLVEANYRVGDVVSSRVVKLMDFGAFVELEPGVEALLPLSEISWTRRLRHAREALAEGDSVRVSILKVEREKRRMTLSLKALGDDPWKNITERYEPDAIVSGRVTRLQDYGAFVELEEGVEGLVHISEMSERRIHRVSDVLEEGQVVKVRIKGIDLEQRRVSLSLKGTTEEQDAPAAPPEAASRPEPKKQKKKRPLRGGLTF